MVNTSLAAGLVLRLALSVWQCGAAGRLSLKGLHGQSRQALSPGMLAGKTLYLARHAETVFNRAGRMQGNDAHAPLTATGLAQASALGQSCRDRLGARPEIAFWCSPTGRTRQTAAAIADALELDYFSIEIDPRLREIEVGDWVDQTYADLTAAHGPILDRQRRFFIQKPPGGEWYDDMTARLTSWAQTVKAHPAPIHLAVSHGLASRVLRGALTGRDWHQDVGATIAPDVPQGSFVRLDSTGETVIDVDGPRSDGKGL